MTAKPVPAFLQHVEGVEEPRVDATAFRQGWRITSRLDGLLAAGFITRSVWQSATDYRDAWDASVALSAPRSRSGGSTGSATSTSRERAIIATLAKLDRLAWVERRLDPVALWLVIACVVEDRSWHAIGLALGCRNVTAELRTARALIEMSRLWLDPHASRGKSA